jgi:hypothetical protein
MERPLDARAYWRSRHLCSAWEAADAYFSVRAMAKAFAFASYAAFTHYLSAVCGAHNSAVQVLYI